MNAVATLLAAGTGAGRRMLLATFGGFALLATIAAGVPSDRRAAMVFYLLMLPTMFLWAGWFARLLLLQRDAASQRIPGASRAVAGALALAVATTVLPPAALVAWLGMALPVAIAGFASAAAAGLLFMLLPRGAALCLCLLPMVSRATGLTGLTATIDPGALVPALAVALLLACAWLWVRLLRVEAYPAGAWTQPFLFLAGETGSFWRARVQADLPAGSERPRWLQPGVGDGSGPRRPVAAMRTLLGSPFAPATPRQLAMQLVVGCAFGVVAWRWLQHGNARGPAELLAQAQAMALVAGGAVVAFTFALRLQQLHARASGTLAELALLPGWGDAARARRTLLAAVGRPMAAACGMLLAIELAIAVVAHDGAAMVGLLVLAVAGIALGGGALCLRALLGAEIEAGGKWALMLAGILMFALTSAALDRGGDWRLAAAVAWAAVCAAAITQGARGWREFHARPHPFLLD